MSPTKQSPQEIDVRTPRQQEGEHPTTDNTRQPPTNPKLVILHHMPGRYIVVEKPADVRMDGDFNHTVEKLTYHYLRQVDNTEIPGFALRFVQRLDYATSGVLLIALSKIAAGVAATQFERRDVKKEYVALVHGHVQLPSGEESILIDQPIANGLPEGSYHMTIGYAGNEGRASRTKCTPIQYGHYREAPVTKMRLQPESGRRHQLRVHLAHYGCPIVGDATYAEREDDTAFGQFIPPRMMLHAKRLELRLPDDKLYGRKSGLRTARPFQFETEKDPFDELDGLHWQHVVRKETGP